MSQKIVSFDGRSDMKKNLKIAIKDINLDSIKNLLEWLSEIYTIEITNKKPDFVIHSCFGHEHLKYNCVRFAWLGENIQPDFNISDYAIGFGRINYSDRYMRIPLYRWYFPDYESLFDNNRNLIKINGIEEHFQKHRFCTMVISNSKRGEYFDDFYSELNKYKNIDSGGKVLNNIGGAVEDKIKFLSEGKFTLAFENSSSPGYVTEKILHAFSSHTIPIYWGAPDIIQDFNHKALINCNSFRSVEEVIAEVCRLDQDQKAYIEMLEQPIFEEGKEPIWLSKKNIMSWLICVFNQTKETAYRRNIYNWGEKYQKEQLDAFYKPHIQMLRLGYRFIRNKYMQSLQILK